MSVLVVRGGRPLRGRVVVPGDKSISHRALVLGALAGGPSRLVGISTCRDVGRTRDCLRALGVGIETGPGGAVRLEGRGLRGLGGPAVALDCGDSGTTMRLLAGVLAAQERSFVLAGSAGLRRRPMERVVSGLRVLGARVSATDGRPPVRGRGGRLQEGEIELAQASAQVGSAVLLAALCAGVRTVVRYPGRVRDHTERMLAAMGAPIVWSEGVSMLTGSCRELAPMGGGQWSVPGDLSCAAFALASAGVPGSEVRVEGVGLNPGRTGFLEVLARMGAAVEITGRRVSAGEPVGDVRVGAWRLRGVEVGGEVVPRAIDELPLVAVLGALAEGRTVVRGAAELRHKESDRIAAMVEGLGRLGVAIEALPDGFAVEGPATLRAARVSGHGDHRVVMALTVAGLAATGETVVQDGERTDDSFPGFVEAMTALGACIRTSA